MNTFCTYRSVFSCSEQEVSHLFSQAKMVHKMPGLTVLATPFEKEPECAKVLIITARKSGKAVQRNLVRRRLKQLFWKHRWFERGYSFIIITYQQIHQLSYKELEAVFERMVEQVAHRFLAAR